jgi:hypothetical protein
MIRITPGRSLFLWSLAGLGMLLAGVGGCANGPVPAAEFVAQAERLHTGALQSTATTDRDLNDYFNEIGKRIIQGATNSDPKYAHLDPVFANMQFHLVGSPIPNAFTAGGRHIYIYNGLFQVCENEEELAAVMAHEFAHAVDLDVQHTAIKPDPTATVDKIAYQFVSNPFTLEMEQKADQQAFDFFSRGGWDPGRYHEVYSRLLLAGYGSTSVGTSPNRLPLARRAEIDRDYAKGLPPAARNWRQPPVADSQSFSDLRKRAKPGGESTSPQNAAWLFLRAMPNCVLPADLPAQQAAQQLLKTIVTPPPAVVQPEPS